MQMYSYTRSPVTALAQAYKALGHETRLRIMYLLVRVGELCVCDVERILGATQSTTSRHLSVLRGAGLVRDRREGTWVYYGVTERLTSPLPEAVEALCAALDGDPQSQRDLETAQRVQSVQDYGPQPPDAAL